MRLLDIGCGWGSLMKVAQALTEPLRLMTADAHLSKYTELVLSV